MWDRLEKYLDRNWFLTVGELGFFIHGATDDEDGWGDTVIQRAVRYETIAEMIESL